MKNSTQKFNPLVSIIIPVYNGEKYLSQAIESALNQTYKNIEIIVVNDGSDDNTEKIAKSYGKKIRYFSKKNGGVSTALNLGIEKMEGDYFSWLSHDDIYKPQKIEKQIKTLLELSSKEVIILSNIEIVDENLELIEEPKISDKFKENPLTYLTYNLEIGINGCTLLIHRNLFKRNGLFNPDLKVTQDYDLWSRFALTEKYYLLDEILVSSRKHSEQGSLTIKTVQDEVDELHARLIKNTENADFKLFFNDSLAEVSRTYNLLKYSMNSHISACELFFKYLNTTQNEKKIQEFVIKNIIKNDKNSFTQVKNKEKPILLFYNNIWILGGIERVLFTIFDKLKEKYNIIFLTTNYTEQLGFKLPKEITVIDINENLGKDLKYTILILCKYFKVDIFIGTQNLDEDLLPAYKILREYNIKTIISNHYNYFLVYELYELNKIAKLRKKYYPYADCVFWTNSISHKIYSQFNNNSYFIPNPSPFIVSNSVKSYGKNIVCIGRFDDYLKRLDLSLKIFSKVLKKEPDALLTIVGEFDLEQIIPFGINKTYEQYIKSLSIPKDNIKFVGKTQNVEKFLENADALLFTSLTEGFGMVIIEAASYGVPTFAYEIPGISDLIHTNENGYLTKYNDIDDISENLIKYLTNSKHQQNLKKGALNSAHKYSINNIISEWESVIEQILKNKLKKSEFKENRLLQEIILNYEMTLENINQMNSMKNLALAENKENIIYKYFYNKIDYFYKTNGLYKTIIWLLLLPFKKVGKLVFKHEKN